MRNLLVALALGFVWTAKAELAPGSAVSLVWHSDRSACITGVSNGTGGIGAQVIIDDCIFRVFNRQWTIEQGIPKQGVGSAGLLRIFGNKCLDVKDGVQSGVIKNGMALQLWPCSANNPNQQFIANADLSIRWAGSNLCVDLTNGNTFGGTLIQLWTCGSSNRNQKWDAVPPPLRAPVNKPALVKAFFSGGPCLAAASNSNGAQAIIRNCTVGDAASRQWTVVKGGAPEGPSLGPPTQIRIFGDKCLDNTNGLDALSNKLQIWKCFDGNKNQLWQVKGDGTIAWAGHTKCADVTDGKFADGTRIQLWSCEEGNANQAWTVVPV